MGSQIEQRKAEGERIEFKILELENVEMISAVMMETAPVLVYKFETVETVTIRDKTGAVIEGGESDINRVWYVATLRRDTEEIDPDLAWELMEFGAQHKTPTI